jgi:hypothetical protein
VPRQPRSNRNDVVDARNARQYTTHCSFWTTALCEQGDRCEYLHDPAMRRADARQPAEKRGAPKRRSSERGLLGDHPRNSVDYGGSGRRVTAVGDESTTKRDTSSRATGAFLITTTNDVVEEGELLATSSARAGDKRPAHADADAALHKRRVVTFSPPAESTDDSNADGSAVRRVLQRVSPDARAAAAARVTLTVPQTSSSRVVGNVSVARSLARTVSASASYTPIDSHASLVGHKNNNNNNSDHARADTSAYYLVKSADAVTITVALELHRWLVFPEQQALFSEALRAHAHVILLIANTA